MTGNRKEGPMAQDDRRFDYDPMIYDVMRECANVLRGDYIDLANHAGTAAEREALLAAERGVTGEADQVDIYDVDAVRAKTDEFNARYKAIEDAAKRNEKKAV
jgi:hypothetical protein